MSIGTQCAVARCQREPTVVRRYTLPLLARFDNIHYSFWSFFQAKARLWSIAHIIAYQSYRIPGSDATLSAGQISEPYTQLWDRNRNLPDTLWSGRIVTLYEIQLQ